VTPSCEGHVIGWEGERERERDPKVGSGRDMKRKRASGNTHTLERDDVKKEQASEVFESRDWSECKKEVSY